MKNLASIEVVDGKLLLKGVDEGGRSQIDILREKVAPRFLQETDNPAEIKLLIECLFSHSQQATPGDSH